MEQPPPAMFEAAAAEIHRQIDCSRNKLSLADTRASFLAVGATPLTAILLALVKFKLLRSAMACFGAAAVLMLATAIAFAGA